MDNQKLAELLFPHIDQTPAHWEAQFPGRSLPADAKVTRLAPSPTGFIHLGNLYSAMIGERLAHQSDGVFYLRIEDTDQKREVAGAVEMVIRVLDFFGIHFDEGATIHGEQGDYGPYRQRQRAEIYQTFAKYLVQQGKAYPCFCSEDELTAMREQQKEAKLNFGYYGQWARCRELELPEIEAKLAADKPFVLRFRSGGKADEHITVLDAVRGELTLPENDQDFVLLKSDGIPTYHFAHAIDDHLMRTTHVVRGEEWLATLPIHVQLFDTFGWARPLYCHTAQLMKMDGEVKRKLSKRKDPELRLEYYQAEGYLPVAIREYLLTVLNSNYEEWRADHPAAPAEDFPFTTEKMSNSGTLFDLDKLLDISKEIIAAMRAEDVYEQLLAWAREYDEPFAALLSTDREYALRILSVGRGGERPRKDYGTWQQAAAFLSFYFAERFQREDEYPEHVGAELRRTILRRYGETLDFTDDSSQWFEKVRALCGELNFAVQVKKYKKNPEQYSGSVVDLCDIIRVALSGRRNSPDLWEISQILGEDEVRARLRRAMEQE